MTARKSTEADRMARANAEMKFALEHNCTVLEARRRMNRAWQQDFERRQDERFARLRRCGTADRPTAPTEHQHLPAERPTPRYWWMDQ